MNNFLVELATRSLILAAIGLGLRFALLRSSAHARANVLAITMGGLVLLPLALIVLPRLHVTVAQHEIIESALPSSGMIANVEPSFTFPWMLVYSACVAILLARVAISLFKFKRLEQGFVHASASLTERVLVLAVRAREVFLCPTGEPPMTWGLLHPKIALPAESEEWIEPQLRSVVLHEDAHIRRKDWAVMIGFRAAAAAYWFNPLVWLLQKFYELDSERAADDFVLAHGVDAPEYAGRLVEVAKTLRHQRTRIPAVTMARSHRLNGRVASILSTKTQRGMLKGWTRISVLGLLVTGAVATGTIVPEVKQIRLAAQSPIDVPSIFTAPQDNNAEDSKDLNADFDMGPDKDENVPTKIEPKMHVHPVSAEKYSRSKSPKRFRTSENADVNPISAVGRGAIKIEVPTDADMTSFQKEISDGMKQAKDEMTKSKKDTEDSIRDAETQIDKSEMPEFARKIAKASIKMAQGFADNLVDSMQIDFNSKQKKSKTPPAKPPKSPRAPDNKKDQ